MWMQSIKAIDRKVARLHRMKCIWICCPHHPQSTHYIWFTKLIRGFGTSLVAQWLRISLPMQRTRVRSLVWDDPTCREAAEPVCCNY